MTVSDPGRCVSCGGALTPGARFCRACGAAVEATERGTIPAEPPPPPAGSRRCPACAVPALAGASFCHVCGASLQGDEPLAGAAIAPPPPPVAAEERRRRRSLRPAAAVAACLVVGALVAVGAYLATRGDSGSAGAGATAGARTPAPRATTGSLPGATAGAAAELEETAPETPEQPRESELAPGRYIQSGSFRSPEGAEEEVARLRADGIDVFAIPADRADELLPGLQVLLVGPIAGSGEERRVIDALERDAVSGFGRDLTPSTELTGPSSVGGGWSGEVEESSLRGFFDPRTYDVNMAVEDGGRIGTVDYPADGCGGSMTLIEDDGYSLAYKERIEYGSCIRGGVWHLRPTSEGLEAVWLHDDRDIMVQGTISSLD